MATRIGASAVLAARQEVASPSAPKPRLWRGLCQKFVTTMLNTREAPRAASAMDAWNAVPARYRHTSEPPVGVPIHWKGGKYGHTALSDGDGWCISTDIKRPGHPDRVRISLISQRWGYELLGWTELSNGKRVWTPPKPVSVREVREFVERNGRYPNGRITRALKAEGLDHSIEGYVEWQKICGYDGRDADGIAGKNTLLRLGAKHGFQVVD